MLCQKKHFKSKPTALHGNEDPTALKPSPLQLKDHKFLIKKISSRVEKGLRAYEDNLMSRRRILRALLVEEENGFMDEIKKNKQSDNQTKLNEQRFKKEETKKEDAENDKKLLAKKQLQLDIIKCPEIRELLCKRRDAEIRRIQGLQIKEKQDLQEQEKQTDMIWHQVMINDTKAEEDRNRFISERCHKIKAETKDFLSAQISMSQEEKIKKLAHEKSIEKSMAEKINEIHIKEQIESKEKCTTKKTALAEDLKKQISLRQSTELNERKKEQADFIATSTLNAARQQADIQKQLANKEQVKRELEMFGAHVWSVRAERRAREQLEDQRIQGLALQNTNQEIKHRCQLETQRKKLLQETLMGRDSQLEDKKKELVAAIEQACVDAELRKKIDMEIKEENRIIKMQDMAVKTAYRNYLQHQIQLSASDKAAENANQLTEYKKKLQEEENYNKNMLEIMARKFKSEQSHPFTISLQRDSLDTQCDCPAIPETSFIKY